MEKSLYAKYIKERENKYILEKDYGFVTYSFNEKESYVYIEEIYVLPEYRKENKASTMAEEVAEIAKTKGIVKMLGSVCPSANGSTISLKVLLGYGFKLLHSNNDMIYFIKEIK